MYIFDLKNEVAPPDFIKSQEDGEKIFRNRMEYIQKLWSLYVNKYGIKNASFSTPHILNLNKDDHPKTNSLRNLLTALKKSNKPLPKWYPVNIYPNDSEEMYLTLQEANKSLTDHGLLHEPLLITETFLNYEYISQGLKKFILENNRPVTHYINFYSNTNKEKLSVPFHNTAYNNVFGSLLNQTTTGSLICWNPEPHSPQQKKTPINITIEVNNLQQSPNSRANLCVSSNDEDQKLVFSSNKTQNSYTNSQQIPWILNRRSYTFYLYQTSQTSSCSGVLLDSCIIKAQTQSIDLNFDGIVDIFDYNILINGFGTKYDIFDYNELVNNYQS
ncbi:MAG: hypothetical protein HN846_01080 [Candidatus Pacebacteria bacterium]|jgi:hypothetical protein|nr:hypothetical protein [Candidatus Paceibacterota bacterium]MBT4004854.1 hypothetical protein [Candidatus Paceibacterota bacterium]MBT4359322.1 hypothetical protein [Candidatus Paceibacterota bacterium]MBT4680927.1 hypothetical protein [Candidatus Paceibacterota bacterium]MBT6898947.1 hypothetical protein [Candidatus Paceibacterota bacterium]